MIHPGSCKSCSSRIPVFVRKVLLIFWIIYQIAHLYNWPNWPNEPFDLCQYLPWMTQLLTLGDFFSSYCGHVDSDLRQNVFLFGSYWQCPHTRLQIKILNPSCLITCLLDDCAGGSQGVQLLDGSNQGKIWAIRLRRVWDSWHPSIQSWSLWIGKSTCSCEPTLPED